jgi:hypothetical protein
VNTALIALGLAALMAIVFGLGWDTWKRRRPLRVGEGVRIPGTNPDQGVVTEIRGRLRSRTALIVLRGTSGHMTATSPTRALRRIDTSSWEHL